MNNVKLKSCVFNNFMSYGNNANEFTFPDGVVWVRADNGSGKSTLLEAINFALFGKSYRGGKQSELRNTRNTEGTMRVILEFDCSRVPDVVETYRVTRSLPPTGNVKFELEKLEGGHWVKQAKRAGFAQKDFEDNILGFNEVLFKNDIAMNTQETIPFLEMNAKDRHALLESIIMFNCEPWKKETGSRLSAAMSAFDIAENDVCRFTAEIDRLKGICEKMRQEKAINIQLIEQRINDENAEISAKKAEIDGITLEYNAKQTEVSALRTRLDDEAGIDRQMRAISNASNEVNFLSRYKDELARTRAEMENVTANYNEMHYDDAKRTVERLTAAVNEAQARKVSSVTKKTVAETSAASRVAERNRIAEQGKSITVTTNCPTCGKPYTEDELATRKAEVERQKNELRRQWSELNAMVTALTEEVNTCNAEIENVSGEIAELQGKLQSASADERKIADYYTGVVIPAQNAVRCAENAVAKSESTIKEAGIDPVQFTSEYERLAALKDGFPALRLEWQKCNDSLNEISGRYQSANACLAGHTSTLASLTAELSKAKEITSNDSLAMTEQRLAEVTADLEDADFRRHKASDDRIAYEYIKEHVCSDDGLKKMIFAHFIPAFNKSVANNIRRVNLPFIVEFDETMDYRFISEPGMAPSYVMLSQGQRRRLGFAISMAFRDFITAVGNFRINFLSMDEVLDISTDESGMRDMLDIVRDMAAEIGSVLVITHRGDTVADKFDYRLTVEHDGFYSTLGDIEKL